MLSPKFWNFFTSLSSNIVCKLGLILVRLDQRVRKLGMTPMSGDFNALYRIISIDLEDSVKTKKKKKNDKNRNVFSASYWDFQLWK